MTIRELMNEMSTLILLDPEAVDYEIVMTGHNEYGERNFEIPVKDLTSNFEDGVLRLWDV